MYQIQTTINFWVIAIYKPLAWPTLDKLFRAHTFTMQLLHSGTGSLQVNSAVPKTGGASRFCEGHGPFVCGPSLMLVQKSNLWCVNYRWPLHSHENCACPTCTQCINMCLIAQLCVKCYWFYHLYAMYSFLYQLNDTKLEYSVWWNFVWTL